MLTIIYISTITCNIIFLLMISIIYMNLYKLYKYINNYINYLKLIVHCTLYIVNFTMKNLNSTIYDVRIYSSFIS